MSLSWGMRPAEGHVRQMALLLLLGLWVCLSPVQCSQGRPKWRYTSSEVVIPRKETYRGKGLQLPGRLSYSLQFGGQSHIIHLQKKKLLWPRHLMLMTQDDQGALQMDYPYFPSDCYYLGHLEDISESMVTVDTCFGGLEGIMKLDDLAYEIKPLKDSHRFEHVVSQIVADVDAIGPTYRQGHRPHTGPLFPEASSSVAPRMSSRDYASHSGAIKGQLQCSHSMFQLNSNNISNCCFYMIKMFSIVDNFLLSLHLRYYVFSVFVYNNNDPAALNDFRVPGSPIYNYYSQHIYDVIRPHLSCLINKDRPSEHEYTVASPGACQPHSLFFLGQQGRHYLLLAVLGANHVGRSLGLDYDADNMHCVCQRRTTCIMNRYPVITDTFSNCSIVNLQQIVGTPDNLACLFSEERIYHNKSWTKNICGNSEINEGEQCDCGSFKQCYANECCETDCSFTTKSICDKESCCTNCTHTPVGTLCRNIRNICDLPEYCNGSSIFCPEDFYLQDGTPCTEEGYCYHGNCTDRSVQCKEIFGANAHSAEQCYAINTNQFRFGHCSREDSSLRFTACSEADKLCGRLQCTNVTHLPRLQEHVSFHQSVISGIQCFGLDEHRSTQVNDAGRVRTGTPCGSGKFCDHTGCTKSLSSLGYDCDPAKCNFRGVCNNKKHCHCHIGWDPPKCAREGKGGSEDSGPPLMRVRTVKQSLQPIIYLRVAFGRIYALLATLLLGVATNVHVAMCGLHHTMALQEGGGTSRGGPWWGAVMF
uniref:Disintegrin and metalloproteinase domain-containing protein 21 n=1 Tax=Castor canadensis TaxID=51338 RepID=A0A8C0WWI2_CASCN